MVLESMVNTTDNEGLGKEIKAIFAVIDLSIVEFLLD